MTTQTEPLRPKIVPTSKQREVIRAIKRGVRHILTGGAISTAKSYGLAQVFISMAMQFPRTRYGIFRRNLTVLKRTTYQTFRKVAFEYGLIEGYHYKINRSEMYWEFTNGAQIYFLELDETKDPDFNKVKGLELTSGGIDEVNEVIEDGYNIVASRIGRENRHGEPQFLLTTCNPADNWVKERWYNPWVKNELPDDHLFIPSLPKDNPHNSAEYLNALDRMPLQFKKRYVEGNWEYVDDSNALFPNRVIDRAITPKLTKGEKFIGVDVAREGTDKIVFALIEDDILVDLYEPDVDRTDESPISDLIADELILYMQRNGVGYERVSVDAVGNGGGVIDSMRRRKYFVKSFISGSKPTETYPPRPGELKGDPKFDMLRSERYVQLSDAMQAGTFKIYSKLPNMEELRKDLLAHTFQITNKLWLVEDKKNMKKRLHRSPDFSDAVAMAYSKTKPISAEDVTSYGNYDDWFSDD